jgi:transposase-like protein
MTDWIERAACRDMDPGVFQADEPEYDEKLALATCNDLCPVREKCLTATLNAEGTADARRRYGIFGGMLPGDRARLDRRTRRGGNTNLLAPRYSDRLTDQEHTTRKEHHARGLTVVEIGRLCNVSATTIQKWRQLYGIEPNKPPASADTMLERARLVELGLSNREIADREGVHIDTIRAWRTRRNRVSA